jgi:hypothetical protein
MPQRNERPPAGNHKRLCGVLYDVKIIPVATCLLLLSLPAADVAAQTVISGNSYASIMRSRARRDSFLETLRGGEFRAEHFVTAYRDSMARVMVAGARLGRQRQDSSLLSYDVRAYARVNIDLKVSALGRARNVQSTESAARIRWHRDNGIVIDGEGLRSSTGIFAGSEVERDMARSAHSDLLRGGLNSVPYFAGKEELWLGGATFGFARNDPLLLHPFGHQAEAYYMYQTGDSSEIGLPNGTVIRLRELRVTPRKAHWTLIVGSFWFDVSNYRIVRAAYRPSEIVDAWEYGEWSEGGWDEDDQAERQILGAIISPFRATVSGITIEYALRDGRFWLPIRQVAVGEIRVSLARIPVEIVERFDYATVNADLDVPPVPLSATDILSDSLWTLDSLAYHGDTAALRTARDRRNLMRQQQRERNAAAAAARRADTTRRAVLARDSVAGRQAMELFLANYYSLGCAADSTVGSRVVNNRRNGTRMLVRVPCSDSVLANSPHLSPPRAANPGDALEDVTTRALMQQLGMGLQAGWGARLPQFRFGFGDSLLRYNRVEGLSPALGIRQVVGHGFAIGALARIGTADGVFGGELSVTRSNARRTMQLAGYRRLAVVNDWGDPFTLGASMQALVFGRDEGFYYRAHGVEFAAATQGNPGLQLRLFSERHLVAHPQADFSLARSLGGAPFGENLVAEPGDIYGASLDFTHSTGTDPNRFRVFTRVRGETGLGDYEFGRGLVDVTVSRALFGVTSASLTLSAGSTLGDVPSQRMFVLGGTHSIRGQRAGVATGDAFWMSRFELGTDASVFKPVVFADFGWAGSREEWRRIGRPLSGVGIGASFLDGMVRFDLARGINPSRRLRFAMYFDARL